MPGAYAHLTLVNELRSPERLENIDGFPRAGIMELLQWFKYCELGAVSPDYPYLAIGDNDAGEWADLMHYTRTGQVVQAGVRLLRTLDRPKQGKCLAWLLGYASHVAADVTIHPVVELKVGPYAENKSEHRVCEMNQDAYIFQRLDLGGIGLSDHLESGIAACSDPDDYEKMDQDVVALWRSMLQEVHPDRYVANPPDIDNWHERFNQIVEGISSVGNHLLPFARHVAAGVGLTYPTFDEVDRQYIDALQVPTGQMGYDEIFERAILNVGNVWKEIATGVLGGNDTSLTLLGDWNLDTGRNEHHRLVFWG